MYCVKHKKQANKYILKIWSSWCRDDIVMIQTFVGPSAGEANWDQMAHCCFVDDGNDGFDNDLGDNYDDCVLSIILVITFKLWTSSVQCKFQLSNLWYKIW